MAAYIVFLRERTHDPAQLDAYARKAPAASAGHALTPHAVYGHHEVLEGHDVEGVAIIAFPTLAEARAWYDSPAYRDARAHRLRGADYRAVLVEGV
ncbi:DUF1330 domain-containing protein [Chondromyces apiculatus]|uniref:DUF1330 domain-containing protein n=1 Tax=Chondromyces apiculatus DSM 436 TaxID=1192034 RepID=A0A017T591_9BACT|nr:DUF1330 domain-containing protein [Chondromyces apiculatus]EYF04438.1 Hypothetical protein CAP_4406 [Chondromyces apiculatus DSM 436]